MKKADNILKNKSNGEYYFIKPFEIVSSYTSFIDTWKIANKVCKEIEDVSDTSLLQSYSDTSKFGFISYSKWESKESFIKSNKENTVLGYHNTLNGSAAKSATQYLYKLKSGEKYSVSKKDRMSKVFMLEADTDKDDAVIEYWDSICSKENDNIQAASLYKSIYKDAKFRFIGILQYDENNLKSERSLNNLLFEAKRGFKAYSIFFKTAKKY